jgi:A/G-specific adenine glycosylase
LQTPDRLAIGRKIESWFARHQRPLPWRAAYDPYHVWVSEVMLQQTRMEVVLPYFERFLGRFPTIAVLAAASDHDVMAAWSGLGYYRRARMLREGAAAVMERFDGTLPSTIEELLTIPGIGRYTAGAIASVAFERRAPIVDGNVGRIVARLFGAEPSEYWQHAEELVAACTSPRGFNQGLMELGALICKPKSPSCLICPLRKECVALATGRVDDFPRPKPKKTTRELHIPLYVITDRRGRILMRRERGALMHAMYHLPHGNTSLLGGRPLDAEPRDLLGSFRHTVTTRKIEFAVYTADVKRVRDSGRDEYEWIDPEKLDEIPHPSYVRKAMKLIVGPPASPPAGTAASSPPSAETALAQPARRRRSTGTSRRSR